MKAGRASALAPLRHRAEWVILATTFVANLGVQYISPLLPAMRSDLHLTTIQVGWIVGGYSLPSLLVTIPSGIAADLWGPKRVLIGCLLLFGVSGLGAMTATGFEQLLLWRVLQGIAFAPIASLTISMVSRGLPLEQQAMAQGYRAVVGSGAEFVQPVIAGFILAATGSWRPAFYLFFLCFGVAISAALVLPSGGRSPASSRGGRRADAADAFRDGAILGVTFGGFCRWFVKYGFFAYMPLYLAYYLHAGPREIGFVVGIEGLVGAVVASQAGRLGLGRLGRLSLAGSLLVFGACLPAATLHPDIRWAAAAVTVLGIADGILGTLLNSFISTLPPASVRVTVVSVSGLLRNVGKTIAPSIMGALVLAWGYPAGFAAIGLTAMAAPAYLVPLWRGRTRIDRPEAPVR